jgi:hypothetical protein
VFVEKAKYATFCAQEKNISLLRSLSAGAEFD